MNKYAKILSTLVIFTNLAVIVLVLFWLLFPYQVTNVVTPITILNENHEVAVGTPIIMEIIVNKPHDLDTISRKFITCDDGNLVTLANGSTPLPKGEYTIISNTNTLPPKVLVGSTCVFTFIVFYEVNPIREVKREWTTEPFKVIKEVDKL